MTVRASLMRIEPYAPKDRLYVLGGLVKGLGQLDAKEGVGLPTATRWAYGWSVRYLGRDTSRVTVLTDGHFQAPRGFLAADDVAGVRVLHWVWVEPSWRRKGAATALLDEALGDAPVIGTTLNVEGVELLGGRRWTYIPQVRWATVQVDDWKLSDSSKHHRRIYEQVAEWCATTPHVP